MNLSSKARLKHRLLNIVESLLLMMAMLLLLAFCSYFIWGEDAIWMVTISASLFFLLSPKVSPAWIMRLYRAQPLDEYSFPFGIVLVRELAARADLVSLPKLYYVPSFNSNAFSVGSSKQSAIAITDGLIRRLTKRELAGVLAHEISHISHNDLWIMGVADLISRMTSLMAQLGLLLLVFNLPFVFGGKIPWLLVAILIFSPLISNFMQLTLSRLREFNADLSAAKLTGDPKGLALALEKLEFLEGRSWEQIIIAGKRAQLPSILRTHPSTERRVERLGSLDIPATSPLPDEEHAVHSIKIKPSKRSKWNWRRWWP